MESPASAVSPAAVATYDLFPNPHAVIRIKNGPVMLIAVSNFDMEAQSAPPYIVTDWMHKVQVVGELVASRFRLCKCQMFHNGACMLLSQPHATDASHLAEIMTHAAEFLVYNLRQVRLHLGRPANALHREVFICSSGSWTVVLQVGCSHLV